MCGVVGLLALRPGQPVRSEVLERMRDRIAHRGPDGTGSWIHPTGRVGLGHRRLSIVDLSPAAAQPMSDGSGRVHVTFNGEIYNHRELRRELEARGRRFRTDHSDTETLVQGFLEWGADGLLSRLNGIFAFALYDDAAGRLVLARDPLGVKPLYFAWIGAEFAFASEIKALVEHPGLRPAIEPTAIYHYLTFMTAPAPLTTFEGVFKLPAGWCLEIPTDGPPSARRYWDPLPLPLDPRLDSEAALAGEVLRRLERAVDRQMQADVPVGVFLSGGVDSSAILALASRRTSRPMDAFSVGFRDHPHLNEIDEARSVARAFGARHHTVEIDEQDMIGYLGQLVADQDEPIADWVCIPLFFVAKLAAEAGVKVVLVGEGADEQFCGYDHYIRSLVRENRIYERLRPLVPAALGPLLQRALAASVPDRLGLLHRADFLDRIARGRGAFWGGAVVFWETMKRPLVEAARLGRPPAVPASLVDSGLFPPRLFMPDSHGVVADALASLDRAAPGADPLTRMIYLELQMRLPELLLMRVDKMTMANSLEARVPFLDPDLVRLTMSIPAAAKIPGGQPKHLLKRALAGVVPQDVLDRPKRGFGAPMREWLRGPFGATAEAAILDSPLVRDGYFNRAVVARILRAHRSGEADTAVYFWTLFNLAAWHDRWIGA